MSKHQKVDEDQCHKQKDKKDKKDKIKEDKDNKKSKIQEELPINEISKPKKEKELKKTEKPKKDKENKKDKKDKKRKEELVETKCSDQTECNTNCHESIDVDVDILPDVICKRIENNNKTTFFIELDINSKPNCRIIKKEVYDPTTCKTIIKHILLLESDVKLDCMPKIKQTGKPSAKYEMDVVIDTESSIR